MAQYRILTLNAAFLPRTPVSPSLPDYTYRVDKISEIIIRDRVDIVVLNEVFVPEIRARLIRNLENTHVVPGGMGTCGVLGDGDALWSPPWPEAGGSLPLHAPSVKSLARQRISMIRQHTGGTHRSRKRAALDTWRDVPLVDSGLLVAVRKGRGLICADPPHFVPWARRGSESITARMGFFQIKLGLRHAAIPSSLELFGLHMNPYPRHRDIRADQLNQLSTFMQQQDDGVAAPLLKLVVGDFNIVGESDEYRATLGRGGLAGGGDLYRMHHQDDPGFTWSSENPLTHFALDDAAVDQRLDYMFLVQHPRCRKRLRVSSIEVARCAIDGYEYKFASDHFGLLLEGDIDAA